MAKGANKDGAKFLNFFGPLLDALRDLGGSGTPQEVVQKIVQNLSITDDVQNETLPSGEPRLRNQIHWARFYLTREGFLESSKRGVWSISEKGIGAKITLDNAKDIFAKRVKIDRDIRSSKKLGEQSIEETIFENVEIQELGAEADVLGRLIGLSPAGFERLSQRILREAGFSEVHVTGRSGDEGIDGYGTLQINPLISFKVLFQCKKYRGSVGSPEVRNFRGAMQGRADKGLILTTGSFTAEARREAGRDGAPPIELIDGQKLIALLEELELGLKRKTIYEIDEMFFDQFR